jgi:hypothetical protein
MEETNRTFRDDEGDETMIAPRFNDEETVLARPVVPLGEVGDAPAAHATTPLYSRLRGAPRRSLIAALVLVSALAGSVLGVGGLYLYQKQRSAAAAAPAADQQQSDAPTPAAAQPTAEAESQKPETNAPAAEVSAPAAAEPEAKDDDDDADSARDAGTEEAAARPVVEHRNISEERDPTVATKRGKKGERDEEVRREERRARREDDDSRLPRSGEADDDRREARRVGVITYRPRRVRQRRGTYDAPDRLRRIFEGQP